jgi:hypothetical protein
MRPPAQRAGTAFEGNTAGEMPPDDVDDDVRATAGSRSST